MSLIPSDPYPPKRWLDLAEAARLLGVHFTTLRRWADAGQVPHLRTPGGRRRFLLKDLQAFIAGMRRDDLPAVTIAKDLQVPQKIQKISPAANNWLGQLSDSQRRNLRNTGQRLMALLMRYNQREEGMEAYLEEGRRIAAQYADVCYRTGLTIADSVRVISMFNRSILMAIQETNSLSGGSEEESQTLFERSSEFLDELLVTLVDQYGKAAPQSTGNGENSEHESHSSAGL